MASRLWIIAFVFVTGVQAAPLRVGKITVRLTPLFSASEARRGGFYRAADRLQVATHEALIRKFLLFHEGDELDEAKLHESERNLRQLDFLRSVSISAGPPHDGVVDVVVATEDAVTTDVNADFSNDGGRALYDVDITQKNLFNRAADVEIRVANGRERRTNSIEIIDPEMFGPYWTADALGAVSSDGNEEKFSLERPLFSYATPFTALASYDHLLQNARTYRNGVIDTVFRQSHRESVIQLGRVIRARPAIMTRVLAGADLLDDSFRAIRGTAPAGRHFRFLEIGIDRTRFNFVSLDHVDYGMRKQDFNLGAHAALFAAVSSHVWRVRGDGSYGRTLGPYTFLITRVTGTIRLHAANQNSIFSDDTRLIVKLPAKHPQTFVARGRVDLGWELDRDVQFLADGQNGLRAYPNFAFEGRRRIVVNAEHRVFLGRELLQLFEPGLAAFVDTGETVNGGFHWRRLRTDFGVGLRCAIARLDTAMVRIDFSYAVNNSPTNERGFEISFATVQAF